MSAQVVDNVGVKQVAIFGLLPNQQEIIKREFEKKFKLLFNKDVFGGATTGIVKKSDIVILMTKFLSHKQQAAILSFDRKKCLYCNGGTSSLKELLIGKIQPVQTIPQEEKRSAYLIRKNDHYKKRVKI